jgi:NitT/TauT family transport system substrate-binding protein
MMHTVSVRTAPHMRALRKTAGERATPHRTVLHRAVASLVKLVSVLIFSLVLTACSTGFGGGGPAAPAAAVASATGTLRLGYFANLTHATALVGVDGGYFQSALGTTRLATQVFNAGPDEISALLTGAIDAAYVGPSPAINGYVTSHGQALRIIAGATTGGAELVVKPSITSIAQLKGATLATPQLGNTQDVALRYFLGRHGLRTAVTGGGDVTVEPTANATTLGLYAAGRLDGAWLPEPYASQLVAEGAHVLVDERALWPDGRFTTTDLVVSTAYLNTHPAAISALLRGQVAANAWITANPAQAQAAVNAALKKLTGKALAADVLTRAWTHLAVTNDPLAATLQAEQARAVAVGLVKPADLAGILDLGPLDAALEAAGQPTIDEGTVLTQ